MSSGKWWPFCPGGDEVVFTHLARSDLDLAGIFFPSGQYLREQVYHLFNLNIMSYLNLQKNVKVKWAFFNKKEYILSIDTIYISINVIWT